MKRNILFVFQFFSVILCFTLVACASGTALVTGTKREPTDPKSVLIYSTPPKNYEVIGVVSASSDAGWTEQGSLDYAVEEIKKQAAKIGANGVILENVAQSSSGGVLVYGIVTPITSQNISGKAIYVSQE